MSIRKIKKGDDVVVLTGRSRGQRGTVLSVNAGEFRVVVEGVNLVKRHTKPNPQTGTKGGIVEREAPIHISNVAVFNPITGMGDRVGVRVMQDGRKVRTFQSTDEVVDL